MKLEVGESLFYSWLRHVKKCQVVQINWKPSIAKPSNKQYGTVGWDFDSDSEGELRTFIKNARKLYQKSNCGIFKNLDTEEKFAQLIRQTEIDILGLSLSNGKPTVYAVDVAYHRGGLGYPNNTEKVLEKILRATVCIRRYFNKTKANIIFASPKIGKPLYEKLKVCVREANELIRSIGADFSARIIANDEFGTVIDEVQSVSDDIDDMSELFLRSYQLLETCKKMS